MNWKMPRGAKRNEQLGKEWTAAMIKRPKYVLGPNDLGLQSASARLEAITANLSARFLCR